jgi:hypothetical protein
MQFHRSQTGLAEEPVRVASEQVERAPSCGGGEGLVAGVRCGCLSPYPSLLKDVPAPVGFGLVFRSVHVVAFVPGFPGFTMESKRRGAARSRESRTDEDRYAGGLGEQFVRAVHLVEKGHAAI